MMGGQDDMSISQFIWDIRYIILFYILGDGITTIFALGYGQETNFFLEGLMLEYGIYTIFLLKFFYIAILFYNYKFFIKLDYNSVPFLWRGIKYSIGVLGILLTTNNLMVIYLDQSFIQIFSALIIIFQ